LPAGPDGRFQGRSSDVAIIGAPIDLGAGDRPGARYGPDAIRTAPYLSGELYHMEFQTEIFKYLSVVDAGNSPVPVASHDGAIANLRKFASTVVANTDRLVTLGGDNSIVLPVLEALAERHGPVALVHFDAHTDTWGADLPALTHATVIRRAVERGLLRHGHQIGIRGYGPPADVLQWGEENGLTCWNMEDIEESGLTEVIQVVCERVSGPAYLSIDIDVLDPAFAPGTGTPEPGGLTSRELLGAVRTLARHLDLVGMDVVEVSPPYDHADITATAANRCVMEFLAATAHRLRTSA
jgi:agmatinase